MRTSLSLFACFVAVGCSSLKPGEDRGDAGATDTSTTDTATDIGGDAPGCPTGPERPIESISGLIDKDTTWTCRKTYLLNGNVIVKSGVTLTVEAGALVQGSGGSILVVAKGAKLRALGTEKAPVVFTSNKPAGSRGKGDWGGVALLGAAPTNLGKDGAFAQLPPIDPNGVYGGAADHDCGTLSYVRIEYAGKAHGLALAGCGNKTIVDHVQVHRAQGDGVRIFGGTVNLKYLVVTRPGDDCLQWSEGYVGKIQYFASQMDPDFSNNGLEGQNLVGNDTATPRSQPTIFNMTLVGPGTTTAAGDQTGWLAEAGSYGVVKNSIIMYLPGQVVDISGAAGVVGTTLAPPLMTIDNSIFWQVGSGGTTYFNPTIDGDDGGFDEQGFFLGSSRGNRTTDPLIGGGALSDLDPNLVPGASSPAATGAAVPPGDGFFDPSAVYIGAFKPTGTDWMKGWATFTRN